MKINEDFRDDDFDYYEPEYNEPDPKETNLRDCQDEAYEYAKKVRNDVIKSQKNFLDENNLEILDTDIEWDFSDYSIPREFTLLFYVTKKDEDDDRVENITCELELSGEFIGREWQKYYKATYEEPEEGGYFDYVEYDEDPSDLKDVITDFVNQVNKKFNSVDECFESLEEGEDTNKYEEIAEKLFSFYKDYDPYGYDDAFGGLTGVNEGDAINDTITSLVYDPQNTLDELEEIKKDLEISLEDGENDTDRNYLRTVNDLIDTINALPNLNEAMFGPYKYRYEVRWTSPRGADCLLGGSKDIDRAIDIACNQLENIAANPWEEKENKVKFINSLRILDANKEEVDSDDLDSFKKEILKMLGESLKESEIEFDDDLVVVISPNGQTIYKGIEDYEPMKDEDWKYDYDCDCYRFEGYTKYKIDESLTEDLDNDEDKYTLIGVDGNAYSVMGYTANALKREGLKDLVKEMYDDATSSDYDHLLAVCLKYVDMANAAARGEDLDESVDKNPVKWEIIRKHKVQKPIDAKDFVEYISDEEVLETTDPMTRREAEKYAKKKYGSAKSKSGSGIHKIFVESEMNESAETTKLYKAISDTADAIDDLTVDDLESAIKNLDSADDKISDVKDNLEEDPEES